jgi:hypothetical protein
VSLRGNSYFQFFRRFFFYRYGKKVEVLIELFRSEEYLRNNYSDAGKRKVVLRRIGDSRDKPGGIDQRSD